MTREESKTLQVGDIVCDCRFLHLKIVQILKDPEIDDSTFVLEGGAQCGYQCLDFVHNHTEQDHP